MVDNIKHEANCLANQLLGCAADLIANPNPKTIRRISSELDGWASSRALAAENGALVAVGEDIERRTRKRRLELLEDILNEEPWA